MWRDTIDAVIVVGAVVALSLSPACSSGSGPVHLSVQLVVEHCPLVTSWKASPLQATAPGGMIDVSVTANETVEPDAGALGLDYMWSATAGTFNDAAAPTSVYECTTAGPQILTASVTDLHRRVPCADVVSLPVTCKAP